jgi:hypothetical protein
MLPITSPEFTARFIREAVAPRTETLTANA